MTCLKAALLGLLIALILHVADGFQPPPMARSRIIVASVVQTPPLTPLNGWLGDLWEEMIEVATYGPSERRILAERRKRAAEEAARKGAIRADDDELEEMTFAEARRRFDSKPADDDIIDDDLSPAAFRQAAAAAIDAGPSAEPSPLDDFDGYALRHLLINKWGAPLDVDFQRDVSLNQVYCTVLPIAFGQRLKCRHETELDYLMHLQGIVEVLRKYEQLEDWVAFVESTNRSPKAGTDSVPYRLNLNEEQKKRIL